MVLLSRSCKELVTREAFESLEPSGKIVSAYEVREMTTQLIVGFVMEAFDGRVLDGAVHALDLPIGPGMLGPSQLVIDIVAGAGHFKGIGPEWFLSFNHAL